jgi:hypothetical protein
MGQQQTAKTHAAARLGRNSAFPGKQKCGCGSQLSLSACGVHAHAYAHYIVRSGVAQVRRDASCAVYLALHWINQNPWTISWTFSSDWRLDQGPVFQARVQSSWQWHRPVLRLDRSPAGPVLSRVCSLSLDGPL